MEYKMTAKELMLTSGSSKGSQMKFLKDGYWYKIDGSGPEGKAEEVASNVLSFSDLKPEEYVKYEACKITYERKTYNGCRSKSFLSEGEQLYSFERIYQLMYGGELAGRVSLLESPKERIDFVAGFVKDFSGLDVLDYIAKNLTVDMLLLNTDRHFNNFGVIADLNDYSFRVAPIFDNGASFLSNYDIYPPSVRDFENVVGKPFAARLDYQAAEAGICVHFDFDSIRSYIETMDDGRMKDILRHQANRYEKLLSIDCAYVEEIER